MLDNEVFIKSLENLRTGVVMIRNEKLIYANKTVGDYIDGDPKSIIGTSIYDFVIPENHDGVRVFFQMILKDDELKRQETGIVLNKGKNLNIEVSAVLVDKEKGIVLAELIDVTKERAKNKSLYDFALKLRTVIDEAPIAIVIIDAESVIKYINNDFGKVKKLRNRKIVGKKIIDFEEYTKIDKVFERIIFSYRKRINLDEKIKNETSGGVIEWYHLKTRHIYQDDNYDGCIIMVQNITESQKMQERIEHFNRELKRAVDEKTAELAKKTKKLERGQKAMIYLLEDMQIVQRELRRVNASLDELNKDLESFNYSVSHDLKSPLRVITNYAGFLLEDLNDVLGKEQQQMLEEIVRQGNHMGELLKNLLDFSRFGNSKLNCVNISMKELFEAIVSEVLNQRDDAGRFNVVIDEMEDVKADYALIKQVVVNLVGNAVKFSADVEAPEIHIGCKKTGDDVAYFVKDNGVGFSPEKSDLIFELFTQLKTKKEGTGVGLAIVKRIIEKHGGRVYAEGKTGAGAEFTFVLPKFEQK
jgi:PAS domain S-box-containing protein